MIDDALQYISPHDRETWVRMAMATKAAMGENGFAVWDAWSRQADNYRESDARAVWRSVKPSGGITVGTLYAEAKRNGWQGEGEPNAARPIRVDRAALERQRADEERRRQRRHDRAAQQARDMIRQAEPRTHDYLARKGFPSRHGLVLGQHLLVPMRDCRTDDITGLQKIAPWGEKKFLPGTRAKGSVFALGRGIETWLCEGYATALSILEALQALHRQARIIVAFSAGNLAHVAGLVRGRRYVVADHDESGTGERYACRTGLPWWMPPDPGDANDFHQRAGIRALASELNRLRSTTMAGRSR